MSLVDRIGSLSKNDATPLYLQLQALLRRAINDQIVSAGAAIPTERDLAHAFQVSRITVRKAIDDLTRLLERFPESAQLVLNRAYMLSRDRRFPEAIADLGRVLDLRPKSAIALRARGNAYAELKDFDAATKDYDKAVELEPDLPGAYIARGNYRS